MTTSTALETRRAGAVDPQLPAEAVSDQHLRIALAALGWLPLTRVASAEGIALKVVRPGEARARVVTAISEADQLQRANPAYVSELAEWTGHRVTDGMPAARTAVTTFPVRQLNPSRLHPAVTESEEDSPGALLIRGTTTDDPIARLRAGEATSAVLLAATRMRLVSCPLTPTARDPRHPHAGARGGPGRSRGPAAGAPGRLAAGLARPLPGQRPPAGQ